jgi:hypothetical protein
LGKLQERKRTSSGRRRRWPRRGRARGSRGSLRSLRGQIIAYHLELAHSQLGRTATATGNITAAIRKLHLDPADTIQQLFALYDRGEIKLVRSPDKTLLIETRELRDDELQSIVDDMAEKVQKRLAGFEDFVALVEAKADPTKALRDRFGIR